MSELGSVEFRVGEDKSGNDGEHFSIINFDCGHMLNVEPGQAVRADCPVAFCHGRYVGVMPSENQGIKYDADKPMMDLIPPHMELEVAKVLTAGAQKYSPDGWRRVPDMRRRYIAAAKRHINSLSQGIELDDETGLHHAAHAVCCLMFLGEVELEDESAASSVPFL
ncbi:MAG: dATP/dGTP diphosphohydrolase domain-containing protein [Marinobacter sp.]